MTSQQAQLPQGDEAGLAGRLHDIEALTDAGLSWLDEQSLLNALVERLKTVLGADTAAVLLLDQAAGHLAATAASGIEEEVWQGVRVPLGAGFAGRIAASRQPVVLNEVDRRALSSSLLADRGIRSLCGVPLLAGDDVIGVLHVGSRRRHAFWPPDVELLRLAADRAALAVRSMMARGDRLAAIALHRSLLPAKLPAVPGVALAARYITGSGTVGGDWYDVFVLPGGELGIVVGDVAGSGLQAAVIMGRMRSALRAYVLDAGDPGAALRKLDRKIQHFEPDVMATVIYGMYHSGSGRLRLSSAGHPPPVLAVPGSAAKDLSGLDPAPPIGVADDPPRPAAVVDIPPGALLCLYTDGLVERRDQPLDHGIGRLAATLSELTRPGQASEPGSEGVPLAEQACAAVMRALVGNEPARDDVAVLMLHRQI